MRTLVVIMISQLSFVSYFKMLQTYYCNTQKQSSGELAKFVGKQVYQSLFFSKVVDRLKKRFRHSFFKNTSRRLLWILSFFFQLVLYRYSRNNWNIFQVIRFFLLLKSSFQTNKSRHVDKSSKQEETAIILTKFHASLSITKIRNFFGSFPLSFSLLNQGSLTFLV